jgi:flagellar motor protein MotB
MFAPIIVKRGSKDEAEKPFWISYADLMTALMVLFLVVMSVALLAVTKTVSQIEQERPNAKRTSQSFLMKSSKQQTVILG